jgi:hypothetical protein
MRFRQTGDGQPAVMRTGSDGAVVPDDSAVEKVTEMVSKTGSNKKRVVDGLASEVEREVVEKKKEAKEADKLQEAEKRMNATDLPTSTKDKLQEALDQAQEDYDFAVAEAAPNVDEMEEKLDTAKAALAELEGGDSELGEVVSAAANLTAVDAAQSACPGGCSGHGTCDEETGTCDCEPSFTGKDCTYEICGSCVHGLCHENKCICQMDEKTELPMFFGESCEYRECPGVSFANGTVRVPCSGNGKCLSTGGGLSDAACDCQDGFSGLGCEVNSLDKRGPGSESIVACNKKCTADCDERSKGELELYIACFQVCSQQCTGVAPRHGDGEKKKSEEGVAVKVEDVVEVEKKSAVFVPETVVGVTADTTKKIHDVITDAELAVLGERAAAARGRNSNTTSMNVEEAKMDETTNPVNTEPSPLQKCEKCKSQLAKEAGSLDYHNLGSFLKHVCERDGGEIEECADIEKKYRANQLHDGKNLNIGLGRFCSSFYEVPCKEEGEEEERIR